MSLKDAIREAAEERDKKEIKSQEVIENVAQSDDKAVDTATNKDVNTSSSKAVHTASSKTVKPASKKTTRAALTPKAPTTVASPSETADEEIELGLSQSECHETAVFIGLFPPKNKTQH